MPPESIRSRSGCITCRERKKKCDELFRADGACERCHRGSHICKRGPKVKAASRPRQTPSATSTTSNSASPVDRSQPVPSTSTAILSSTHIASPPPYQQTFPPLAMPPSNMSSNSSQIDMEIQPDLSSFFESLDAFAEPGQSSSVPPPPEDLRRPEDIAAEETREADSWASAATMLELRSMGTPVTDDSVDISPLYAAFNEGFFRSIPKPVREIMIKRMNNVASSSQLGAAASMAMVLLYRARTQPEGNAEAQARLLAQSDHFFQQAVLHLQTPIPLEGKLVACLDLQSHQFDLSGAAASHAVLLLAEFFVTEALGARPQLDLRELADESSIALRCFAYSDVLRSICIRRRRTLFDFIGAPGSSTAPHSFSTPGNNISVANEAVDTHLGLPVGLLLCLAATSNLAVDASGLPAPITQSRAAAIEQAIRMWRPLAPNGIEDSIAYLERLVTFEMWRQAALVHLYQAVSHLGCLATPVRQALEQFLRLAGRDGPRPPVDPADRLWAGSVRACPWFIMATCAVTKEDREKCRQGLSECGIQKGYRDNEKSIERLWEVVDSDGWALDWRELLEREKLFCAFL